MHVARGSALVVCIPLLCVGHPWVQEMKSLRLPKAKIAAFCRRWKITELAFFGSVLRDDFRPDSDVDVLVTFTPDADWSLFDHVRMEEELGAILGCRADIVTRRAIEASSNWIRRTTILESAVPYYVAR